MYINRDKTIYFFNSLIFSITQLHQYGFFFFFTLIDLITRSVVCTQTPYSRHSRCSSVIFHRNRTVHKNVFVVRGVNGRLVSYTRLIHFFFQRKCEFVMLISKTIKFNTSFGLAIFDRPDAKTKMCDTRLREKTVF